MLVICILTVHVWFIEDLVFPHVQVENHYDEDDAIVEPFPCDMDVTPGKVEVEVPSVEARKLYFHASVKVRKVPILWQEKTL